jgi:PAS domain S-box-containing protein
MKGLSSRFYLAVGLSSLVVSVMLLALYIGLVPDRDGALRAGRISLAESVSVSSTALMDDEDDSRLRNLLGFILRRNPQLLTIGLRRADGALLLEVGDHQEAWQAQLARVSSDTQIIVPILRGSERWGVAELRFAPLHAAGWWGTLTSAPIKLIAAVGLICFVLFYLYLWRMLHHLDPSRSIPGRVRTAFDTLAEGLLVIDPSGRIVLANRAFAEVVGGEADDLLGKQAAALAWTNQVEARLHSADMPWAASLDDGQLRRNTMMYLSDAQGRRRTFMVNCSPVPGSAGKPAGVLVGFDDVTELEEKEIELRLARDEAEAANCAKSDFLANMSHEIRTPMNAILGFTDLLRRGYQHSARDTEKYLNIIHGSGRHLLELINDILDLSKVEAGRLDVERIRCEAHVVVRSVVSVMHVKAEEKGIGLRVDFPEPLPAGVLTDPSRLRQIVTNLVGNALKFTQRGAVTVVLRMQHNAEPAQLLIEISDTGVGIAADKLDAIFEPFVQAEASTTRQFGGTGLGLAISRRFARALGGDVTASSVLGQGSMFRVTLEVGALDDVPWLAPQALAAAHDAPVVAKITSWQYPPARVMVVDDGAENRELVRLVLEAAGLIVIEAEHGAAALDKLAGEAVDLVLMDLQMPVMDGYTAVRTMRARGSTIPVLALTANVMKGFEREIEAAGFSGHLSKPVDIDAMLAELARRLGGRRIETVPHAQASAAAAASMPAATEQEAAREAIASHELAPIESRLAQHRRLAQVVRTFGQQLPVKLQAMQAALARNDMAEIAQLGHWLKGAGGTVGFDVFFEPAHEIEQHAAAGRRDALEAVLAQLQGLAQRIVIPEAANASSPAKSRDLPVV